MKTNPQINEEFLYNIGGFFCNFYLILTHCIIFFVGGNCTYAEVPLFYHISEILHQTRNNDEKFGHFAQI